MVRRAIGVLAVLAAWLVLSVLLAPLVGKVRRDRRGQRDRRAFRARMEQRGLVERPVLTVRQVHGGPRVLPDRPVPRAHRAR